MKKRMILHGAAILAVVLAGCSVNGREEATDSASAQGPAGDSAGGMKGMDHSKMDMSDSAGGDMAGMDHSKVPMPGAADGGMSQMDHSKMPMGAGATGGGGGMGAMDHSKMGTGGSGRSAPSGSMAGMDHSTMNMPSTPRSPRQATSAGGMAGMDHSAMNMPGTAPMRAGTTSRPAADRNMAGMNHAAMQQPAMDHSNMAMGAQQPAGLDSATVKLQLLVTALTQDPVVQQRIQADTVLRNRWRDPDVRQILRAPR